jgi:MFS family permease
MSEERVALPVSAMHHGIRPTTGGPAVIAAVFAGSTLITPMYPLYREQFGFSVIVLTLVYAAYVVGNVIALLVFGRLSDQIGRRRVAVSAIVFAMASTLLFLFARGTAWLFCARVLSGFAVGCGSGTATAWIADAMGPAHRRRASVFATTANFLGIAIGPLIAGPLVQYTRHPLELPYLVYLVLLVAVAVVAARTEETITVHRLREVSLKPRIGVPRGLRAQFIAPAIAGFALFALVGFYAALVPSLVHDTLREHNRAIGAAIVAELFAAAMIAVPITAKLASRTAMHLGLALLLPSVALLVLCEQLHSVPFLLAASASSGVTSALAYRGSLQRVNELAPDGRRAEVVSSYFVVCFMGNAVPVIGVGVLTAAAGSMLADAVFGGVIALFAVAALIVSGAVGNAPVARPGR